MTGESPANTATRRPRLMNVLPWMWLGLSTIWAVVVLVTDQPAWPLALWIATTLGPLTALTTRLEHPPTHHRSAPWPPRL